MTIARIIEPMSQYPRCEAERVSVYYCDTATSDRRCLRSARVFLNGHVYCHLHAKQRALDEALGASFSVAEV